MWALGNQKTSAHLELTALELRVLLVWRRNRNLNLKIITKVVDWARKERMQAHEVIFIIAYLYSAYGHTVGSYAGNKNFDHKKNIRWTSGKKRIPFLPC
jgi:hypothetical protein